MRFAYPHALWLLCLMPLICWCVHLQSRRQQQFVRCLGEPHVFRQTPSRCPALQRPWVHFLLVLLLFCGTILALADPRPVEAPPLSRSALQALMWDQVGIVRDGETLARAAGTLSAWHASLARPTDRPADELANMVLVGRLVAEAALRREESRGAHYRRDFPAPRDEWRRHVVFREDA